MTNANQFLNKFKYQNTHRRFRQLVSQKPINDDGISAPIAKNEFTLRAPVLLQYTRNATNKNTSRYRLEVNCNYRFRNS